MQIYCGYLPVQYTLHRPSRYFNYAEFQNVTEIDRNRNVIYDFAVRTPTNWIVPFVFTRNTSTVCYSFLWTLLCILRSKRVDMCRFLRYFTCDTGLNDIIVHELICNV